MCPPTSIKWAEIEDLHCYTSCPEECPKHSCGSCPIRTVREDVRVRNTFLDFAAPSKFGLGNTSSLRHCASSPAIASPSTSSPAIASPSSQSTLESYEEP